jgi:hypothetical protein
VREPSRQRLIKGCARAFQESCLSAGRQLRIYTIGVLSEPVNANRSVLSDGQGCLKSDSKAMRAGDARSRARERMLVCVARCSESWV